MLKNSLVDFFYQIKPLVPRKLQLFLRRKLISSKIDGYSNIWPIDPSSAKHPGNWSGWPENKRFALVLTHDVDTQKGHDQCLRLMKIENDNGFFSSFNIVPERYRVSPEIMNSLKSNDFEVGVHDLNHDGKLFKNERIFRYRAEKINEYLRDWDCVGFRAGAMHCNLEWIHLLNIEYDLSTFDTDPFEAKPVNRKTIFPFIVSSNTDGRAIVELPYTLPQDFTLFVLMQEKNIALWKRKLDWVVEHGGMALINTHTDYMNFDGTKLGPEEYPVQFYEEILNYIKSKYEGQYWHVLPRDMARFCRENVDNLQTLYVQ